MSGASVAAMPWHGALTSSVQFHILERRTVGALRADRSEKLGPCSFASEDFDSIAVRSNAEWSTTSVLLYRDNGSGA
jgi:hypothetical protein